MNSKQYIFKTIFACIRGAVAVEVLVLGGLVATLGIAVTNTFKSTGALEKRINQELEVIDLLEQTTHILRDKANCEASLAGLDAVTGSSVALIETANGDDILQLNQEYGTGSKGRVKLTEMTIGGHSAGIAKLSVQFTKIGSTADTSTINRSIPIRVALSGNNISACVSGDDSSLSALCNSLGGTMTADLKCSNLSLNSVTVSSTLVGTPGPTATPGHTSTNTFAVSTDRGATAPVLAATPESADEIATQDWVINYLKTVSAADRQKIVQTLMASSEIDFEAAGADSYNVLKAYILEEFGVSPGSACDEGYAAISLDFNATTGILTFNCATTYYRPMDDAMNAFCWALNYANGYDTFMKKCW